MQKIINVLSITSFVISVSIVSTGIYLYANKNTLINSAKEKIMGQVSEIAGDKIKEMVPTPSLPNITGPVAPRSTRSGLGVPQF